jgi:outer membrane protein TolC
MIATFFIIGSFNSTAQITAPKELKSLVEASFNHFPKFKEADNMVDIASEKIKLVSLNKQPDVTADAGYTYIRPKIELPINGEKFQFAPLNNFTASFNGTYTLVDFGRLKAAITQAKNELTYNQHNKENIQHQIAYQVANIYYYMVYLKKAVGIQDTILNTLNENKKIIESQYKNGTALEIDLLSIQSTIDAEENRKIDLTTLLNKQEILLDYVSGISKISGNEFDLLQKNDVITNNLAANPDIIMLQDKLQQSKQDVSISMLKNKPVLGLRANVGSRNGYLPNISEMRLNYLAGVNFSVPIYNGGKIKQQIKLQEKLANQQSLVIESMNQTLQKDIKQTSADLLSATERLKRTNSQIALAKYASTLANNKLIHGTGTHLEVTSANTNLQRSLLNQLQLEFQVCSAQLEYARLTGVKYW